MRWSGSLSWSTVTRLGWERVICPTVLHEGEIAIIMVITMLM